MTKILLILNGFHMRTLTKCNTPNPITRSVTVSSLNGNTPGDRVGGVTDGIRARSCDPRSRPMPCIAYSCLRMLHDEV